MNLYDIHSFTPSLIHSFTSTALPPPPTRQTRCPERTSTGKAALSEERGEGRSEIGPLRVRFVVFYFCGPEPAGVPAVRPQCAARVFPVNTQREKSECRERALGSLTQGLPAQPSRRVVLDGLPGAADMACTPQRAPPLRAGCPGNAWSPRAEHLFRAQHSARA